VKCGDVPDDTISILYTTIKTVCKYSYLSQSPGGQYTMAIGVIDNTDDGGIPSGTSIVDRLDSESYEYSSMSEVLSDYNKQNNKKYSKHSNNNKHSSNNDNNHNHNNNNNNSIKVPYPFEFSVYSRESSPEGLAVVKDVGPHKRSVYWVPDIQIIGKDIISV
jgi:hypothetical protein